MSLPPRCVLKHLGLEPLALALLARARDAGHHRQVGVHDAGAVARGAGALGVGAEQRRLHAVGLRERLADRVEQPRVGRRVAAPRALDRGLVDRHHAVAARHRAVDQRALARSGDAGDDDQHAERDVDVDVLQVVWCSRRGPPALPDGVRTAALRDGAVVEVPSGDGVAGPQPRDGALEAPPRRRPGRRPGRGRRHGRRSRSPPACARRRARCCPCRAARSSRSFIRWMSCGCSPIVGSSKT